MGIGLDAKVALGFHKLREKYPKLFKTQVMYFSLYDYLNKIYM